MKEKVLVTGGSGYIGSVLCDHLLREGYRLTVVDNLMYDQQSLFYYCGYPEFEFVCGDVRDKDLIKRLLKKADVIIPLAAIVGAPACDRDPWLARSVNLEAIKLLNSLRSTGQLVIFPVTNSGYGIKSGDVYCTEETPLEPISLYGRTKVEAEAELLGKANAVSLRLATLFGMSPRMRIDLLLNYFTYLAVTQGYILIFEKDFKRNFVHIRDVADCFLHCIQHSEKMAGRPYNVGLDAANMSKEELALKVKEHVPDLFIEFSDVKSDPDKRNYIVSNQRLREAGYQARRSIDDGIRELLKGYRMLGRSQFGNV